MKMGNSSNAQRDIVLNVKGGFAGTYKLASQKTQNACR
jgi:hypothetical protein